MAQPARPLDPDLTDHASSVRLLVEHRLIGAPEIRMDEPPPTGAAEAEALARDARARLGVDGPLPALADVCARFGLYLLVVDSDAEGSWTALDGVGAAVIGGRTDSGGRRARAARQLGRHLFGEAHGIDAFARAFLVPAPALRQEWPADPRLRRPALVRVAGACRVSWDLVVRRAVDLGLVDEGEQRSLAAATPVLGDFLAQLGAAPVEDLPVGATGAAWKRAVLAAYGSSLITGEQALDLLHGALTGSADLPSR
ncbi:ImmA/IrrE family metallo-endopeptidase [Kutzneria sp. NPDC052558]|uniref:ImmA/IrrE family metallo-endopeptidase n=1 Tax=Kutzneria sp. NPDC052558 TaxID=3364121 RepID=UPI0037C760E9